MYPFLALKYFRDAKDENALQRKETFYSDRVWTGQALSSSHLSLDEKKDQEGQKTPRRVNSGKSGRRKENEAPDGSALITIF
jgi:hypothetical protein